MADTLVSSAGSRAQKTRSLLRVSARADLPSPRQLFFAALVATGFFNGISEKIFRSVSEEGAVTAAFATFDVSIIIWGAAAASLALLLSPRTDRRLDRRDLAVAAVVAVCFVLPIPAFGWIGLCAIALHLRAGARDGPTRRAASVILALTIPLFWARILMGLFMDVILRIDAQLVGWAVGSPATDNVVPYADGSGALFLAPGCSSFANLSLAVLSAAIFIGVRGARWSPAAVGWCVVSMAGVMAINILRLALMVVYPAYYDVIHGPPGATVAAWSTLAAIVLVGYHRIGRDAHAPA